MLWSISSIGAGRRARAIALAHGLPGRISGMHDPSKPRLPGDYSHILPPEKPREPKRATSGNIIKEVTIPLGRPALTAEQLRAMGERNRKNKDVIDLLHEIKRLRAHVLRADQLLCSTRGLMVSDTILRLLASEIQDEPCIQELRKA